MYALSDEKFRSSIAGITTLATPFLHLRHFRNLEGIENLPMWAFWGVMFFAPITLLLIYPIFRHIIGFPMPQWLNRTAIAFNWSIWMEISIWILVTFLIFLIACYGLIKLFVRIGNKIDKSAGIGNDPIQQAPREGLNLLVIRAAGDEANGLLGFLQTLGWLTRMIYGLLAFLVRFWRRLRPSSSRTNNIFGVAGAILFWVLAIFSTPIFMVIITYILGVPFPFVGAAFEFVLINFLFGPFADASVLFRFEWWVLAIWICGIGALVLMTSMIAVIVLSLLLSILAYILRLPFGFFGLLSPLGPLTTELTAEPCPVGDWRVIQLGPQEKTLRYNLWHSEPYSHPGALKVIIAWLNNKKT